MTLPDDLPVPDLFAGRPPAGPRPVVAVAMSGGVDSSVAAALCVAAGYEVVGVMLRLWAEPGAEGANRCCTRGAIDDARGVADRLGIPFQVLDLAGTFRERVVEPFVEVAAAGGTPNPCFDCNRRIRFGHLLEQARILGADLLATGHYARVDAGRDGRWRLLRGRDPGKDQSYVLHALGQDQLARAAFPIGGLRKPEVRAIAARAGLGVATRADSVDLCWVGEGGAAGFLSRTLPEGAARPGPILDEEGRVLGEHRGLPYYTLGQRRGLGVALGRPAFVLARDARRNALILGDAERLLRREVRVEHMRYTAGGPPAGPLRVEAAVRYRAPAAPARLEPLPDGGARLRFDEPQRAPTRGQGLVAWRGDEVLGGGPIAEDGGAAA